MYYDRLCDLGIKLTKRRGSEKVSCPKCYDGRKHKNRRDLSVNIDTGEYCCHNNGCDFRGNVRIKEQREQKHFEVPDQNLLTSIELSKKVITYLGSRGITEPTLRRYMIHAKEAMMPQTGTKERCIIFPYLRNATLVNMKFRDGNKNFRMIKDAEKVLFGLQFIQDRKKMILTEGEIDALSCAEIGYGADFYRNREVVDSESGEVREESPQEKYASYVPCSVPNGATQTNNNLEYLDNCFDELIIIEEFVIATDDDIAGRNLKDELVRRLGIERCRVVEYPKQEVVPLENNLMRRCKDLNEVLIYLGKDAVHKCIENAKFIPIEGVYYLSDLYPRMLEKFKAGLQMGETTRMGPHFDEHWRWKVGDVNLGVGYGNHGKTTFQNQLELNKSIYDDWKHAVFCPENFPADDFYDDLIEMLMGKPLQLMSDEEYEFGCRFIQDHFYYVYPEDEHDLLSIFERFRNLILKKGVRNGRIDPWNQLDKIFGAYQMSSEERLSHDLKLVKRFALNNAITMCILAHPKNPTYTFDKDGNPKALPIVDVYDISGGAQWANKPDNVWSYYRPNFHVDKEDPNVDVYIQRIKRKRTGGKLGFVQFVYDYPTRRYISYDGIAYSDQKVKDKILRGENYTNGIATTLFNEDLDENDLPF